MTGYNAWGEAKISVTVQRLFAIGVGEQYDVPAL